jgi:hypothetical protein
MVTVIIAGSPFRQPIAGSRSEDDQVPDGQGLGGGEYGCREAGAGHGGLVQAVASAGQQRSGRLAAGGGEGGDDHRVVQIGSRRVPGVKPGTRTDQADRVRIAAGVGPRYIANRRSVRRASSAL